MANSNSLQFYRDRAEEARSQAAAASLTHVRERCLRAEAAWTKLAEQLAATERRRVQQEEAKAAAAMA